MVEGEALSLGEPPVIGSAVPVYKTYLELMYDLPIRYNSYKFHPCYLIIRLCIRVDVIIPRTSHGDIQGSRNAGKLCACANSGYQALSFGVGGPGYEATPWSATIHTLGLVLLSGVSVRSRAQTLSESSFRDKFTYTEAVLYFGHTNTTHAVTNYHCQKPAATALQTLGLQSI